MKFKLWLLTISFFTLSLQAWAGHEKVNGRLQGGSFVTGGSISLADTKYPAMLPSPSFPFREAVSKTTLKLGVNHYSTAYLAAYNITVRVQLNYKTYLGGNTFMPNTNMINLTVAYDPSTSTATFPDLAAYVVTGGYSVKATVIGIYDNIASTFITTAPANLYLETEIDAERYYNLDYVTTPYLSIAAATPIDDTYVSASDEIEVIWKTIPGAEEYDLEWVWVSSDINSAYKYEIDFKNNSTRIRTSDHHYRISNIFEKGTVFFRVRGVGRYDVNNNRKFEADYFTPWTWADYTSFPMTSLPTFVGGVIGTPMVTVPKYMSVDGTVLNPHESLKDWQYNATYAEEGKKKEVISYFDGSLRNRQTVTRNNSDNNSLVTETYYDYNGRGVIQSLPVPVSNSTIKFYEYSGAFGWAFNFVDGASGFPFDKSFYDLDPISGGTCPLPPVGMDKTTGTSNYYSVSNTDQSLQQAYVPDAEKFPFVQTEFTPDKTGRIRRQSNAGADLALGTNHETKYFYGSPTSQDELDVLFGSEVGDYKHYKKNLVVDPNGQASISYLDQEGRTIATGLAGTSPLNLRPLDPSYTPVSKTVDLLNKDNSTDVDDSQDNDILKMGGKQLSFSKEMLVTDAGPYTFTYDMTGTAFTYACGEGSICYDCMYDLSIDIVDECGVHLTASGYGALPIKKTVGNITAPGDLDAGGNIIFDTDCDPTIHFTDMTTTPIVVNLQVGSYTVIKTLSINEDAMNYYLNQYINNNTCLKTQDDFINAAKAQVDTSGCNIDCEACVLALGTEGDFIAAGGTSAHYQELVKECREPCNFTNTCEATYISLLADMSPGGQYAEWDDGTSCNPGAFPLSVLNDNNLLLHTGSASTYRAIWDNINLTYKDDDGTTSYITVTKQASGAYLPALKTGYVPVPVSGNTYKALPQGLDDVCEFKNHWKDSWAKELVKFHPEYAYYDWCIKNSSDLDNTNNLPVTVTPPSSSPVTSYIKSSKDYDSLMLILDDITTLSSGDLANLQNPLNIDPSTYSSLGASYDPYFDEYNSRWFTPGAGYFKTGTGSANTLNRVQLNYTGLVNYKSAIDRFKNYKGSGLDLWHFAYAIASGCATEFGTSITTSDPCFSSYTGPTTMMSNATWAKFKMLYQSLKQELQNEAAQSYALNGDNPLMSGGTYNRCNDCIGNGNYNFYHVPFASFQILSAFTVTNWITNWFVQPNPTYANVAPCGMVLSPLYKNKIKRFSSMDDVDGLQTGTSASLYQLTGQCPAANDYQAILNALAKSGDLISTSAVALNTYPEFTKLLYDMIEPSTTSYPGLTWNATISGSALNIIFKDGSTTVCSAGLAWTGTPPSGGWSNTFTSIYKLKFTSYSSGSSNFTAWVTVQTGPTTFQDYPVSGTICGNIGACAFDPVCTPNGNANAFRNLFDMLAQEGDFCSGTNINLTAAPYNSIFTNSFGSFLPSGTWNWKVVSGVGTIASTSTGDNLAVSFLTGLSSFCTQVSAGNSVNVVSVLPVSGPSAVPGDFIMNYTYVISGVQYAATVTGHIDYTKGTSTSGFSMGSCDVSPPVCNTQENKIRDDLEAFFDDASTQGYFTASTTPINITGDTYFTPLLQSQITSNVTYNTSTNVMSPITYYFTLNSGTASNVFGATICSSNTGSAPTPGNTCCQLSFSINPTLGKTQNDIVSLGQLFVYYDPTVSGQTYSFKILANFGSSLVDTLYGTTSCFAIRDCAPCPGSTPITAISSACYTDNFDTPISYAISDNTSGNLCYSGGFTNISSTSPITMGACTWGIGPSALIGTTSYNRHTTTSGTRAMFIQVGGGGTTTDVTVYDNTWTIPSTNVCYGFSGWYLKDQDINHKLELYINGNLVGTQLIPYQGYPPIVPIWKVLDFSGATWNNSSAATSMHVVIKAKPTPPGYLSGTLTSFLGFDDFAICELPCGVMPCVNSMQPDTMPVITYTNPCQQLALDAAVNDGMDDFSNYIDSIKTGFVEAYVKKCMGSVIENFGLSYAAGEYQYTLYYYDQAGNLVRTVPPRGYSAVPALSIPTVRNDRAIYPASKSYYTTHSLYTTYTYNSLNQLVKQESPDANTSHFWYDKLGRLVASQNAEQAVSTSPYKYSYTVYDPLGRIDEVGQMGVTGIDFNATALNTLNGYLNASNYPANLTPTKEQITSTFYGDDAAYTITGVNLLPTALSSPQDYIRGRVAAVTIEDVDDSNPLTYDHGTYYNYDIHGNVKELVQHNPDMSFISGQDQKLLQYDYDLISGKVNTVSYQAGKPDQFFHMYEYDADNRLTNAYSSKDNVIWDQDAKYWYYKHGPLARVEIGDCKNQGFDYAYTVQGWIKGANSNLLRTPVDIGKDGQASGTSNYNTLHKWFSKDAYGYSLNYFSRTGASGTFYDYLAINGSSGSASTSFVGDFITNLGTTMNTNGPPLFNGNISHMVSAYVNNDPSATLIGGGSLATFTAYQMLSAYRYDQLNRIATSRVYKHLGSTTNVWAATADVAYGENFMYDMNGNITAVKRSGTATTGFPDMDNLTYNYTSGTNKLDNVNDGVSSTAYTDDIDAQSSGNYTYDNNGNLIGDVAEEIQNISWSVYGKMKTLTRISTSTRPELTFKYDASGNRVSKRVHIPGNPSTSDVIYYYLRDAQGNVMAVYQQHQLRSAQRLDLEEQHVYGSSRLGLLNNLINMNFATLPGAATSRVMGIKSYELTNHLGNVMSVITDRKIPFETSPGSGIIGHYASDIINHQDYYAFGANKPGRTYAVSAAYRYSFNGKEQDGETVGTSGSTQDYGMRIYNPSLGKFLSVDPLTKKYPELTPYQFASDRPIDGVDQDGLEWDQIFGTMASSSGYSPDAKDQEGVAKDFMGDFKETMKDPETYKGALRGSTPFLLAAMTLPFGGVGGGFIAEADATAVSASFEEAAINREMGTVGEGSAYDVVMSGYTPGNVGTPLGKTRLSNQQMIDMTNKHGVEFAQTYEFGPGENGGGGEYYLYSGNKNSVNLPVNKNTMLINHTHPLSTAKPSVYDVEYLQAAMKAGSPQKSSIIIPANASPPVRFNVKSEYMTVPSINYLSH